MERRWAFWRRVQYGAGAGVVCVLFLVFGYFQLFYAAPTCSDGRQNGDERGVDCGGSCALVCAFDATAPVISWAQSFRIAEGQYHAVAYVENRNAGLGVAALGYTFTLYNDIGGVIATRSGTTVLPPDSVYPIFEGNIATGGVTPARTFIELVPVDVWEPMASGREQFEVRDRTLVDIGTRPRLDARVYNTSLDEARDVEIVATIFDARGTALTASRSVVPAFAGREERQVVFTWPEPIATTLRSCEVPTDVMLAIDLSGSMNDDGGTPPEPISSTLAAADAFIGRLRAVDQVGVVTYATDAARPQPLGASRTAAQAAVRALTITPAAEVGATNIGAAIRQAHEEFESTRHNVGARSVLVLLTDGRATAPGADPTGYAREAAAAARNAGIAIYTIGLGSGADEEFLAALASGDEYQFTAADAESLDRIYRSISTALCEEGPAVIDIIPKVPGS